MRCTVDGSTPIQPWQLVALSVRRHSQTLCRPSLRANIVRECRDIQQEADMTPRVPENVSSWLVDWSFATIMGNTMPPRDPNDDDDAEDEDDDAEPEELEPAVVGEPDE